MLMHAHRSAVDHLHIAVISLADGSQNAVPNTSFAPSDKTVVAGRARPELLWQCPPRRAGSQYPEDPVQNRRSSTRGTPRGLFGSNGAITLHSKSVSS